MYAFVQLGSYANQLLNSCFSPASQKCISFVCEYIKKYEYGIYINAALWKFRSTSTKLYSQMHTQQVCQNVSMSKYSLTCQKNGTFCAFSVQCFKLKSLDL